MTYPFESFQPSRTEEEVLKSIVIRARRRTWVRVGMMTTACIVLAVLSLVPNHTPVPTAPVQENVTVQKVWSGQEEAHYSIVHQATGNTIILIHNTQEGAS